jgi:hypothetical protein
VKHSGLADDPRLPGLVVVDLKDLNASVPPKLSPGIQCEVSSLKQAVGVDMLGMGLTAGGGCDQAFAHLVRLSCIGEQKTNMPGCRVYHRKSVDILKERQMSRKPDARTPLDRAELRALRAEMEKQPASKVRETYRTTWEMCKLFGDAPPRPWVIQTLVQAWQELNRRYPKGR